MQSHRNSPTRIAVIGAGAVGSTLAYTLMLKNTAAEIVLIDKEDTKEGGHVMDIQDGLCFVETAVVKGGDLKDARAADIVLITAGLAGRYNESRLSLVEDNKKIITEIFKKIGKLKSTAVVIMVTNPVDILTHLAHQLVKLPKGQVFGTGTALDTARLKTTLAQEFKVNSSNVHGYVLGEHGDSQIIAWSAVTVEGSPIKKRKLFSAARQKKIENCVRKKADEIVKRKGATFFGIAMAAADIVEAVLFDQHKTIAVSTHVDNWNGISGVCMGVPAIIGRQGVERLSPLELNAEEKRKLKRSAEVLKKLL